jgi:hypothetical protein
MAECSRLGTTPIVSILAGILTVSVSVGVFGGLGSAAVTNSSVTETTIGPNNQTVEIRATDIETVVVPRYQRQWDN